MSGTARPRGGPPTAQRPLRYVELDLPALRLDVAQPRIDHRRVDEVDRAAAAGEALRGAQAVGRAEQVAERIARLGLGAQRAQGQAEPAPGLAERAPGERVVGMERHPGLQVAGPCLELGAVGA